MANPWGWQPMKSNATSSPVDASQPSGRTIGKLVSEGDGCDSLGRALLLGPRWGYKLDMGVSVEAGSRDGLEGRAVADEAEAGGEPRPPMGAALTFWASASVLLRVLPIPTDFHPSGCDMGLAPNCKSCCGCGGPCSIPDSMGWPEQAVYDGSKPAEQVHTEPSARTLKFP